jgi:histidine triad (HIT) family protein
LGISPPSVPSHAPPDYSCPFCNVASGGETDWVKRSDLVWQDERTTAFVAPKWWNASPAHVLVIPNEHFENLYAIPDETLGVVYGTAKRVALALKDAYGCEGTSTRQHNEPGGGQDVWHFHVHVYPRAESDSLYETHADVRWTDAAERAPYAERLRRALR